jgi:KDO2-lipid IV(A) lauroyltransferase
MPELSRTQREAILRGEWENLGRTAAEFAHLEELTASRVELRGGERLDEMAREGRQAVFVSGHFANWELMASTLHARGLRTAVVYRAANNPLVDAAIIDLRAAAMTRHLIPKGKRGGRELLSALREGLSLCMLTDQKLSDGIEAPLLSRPALTAPAAARLALKADLPVIPLQIVRQQGARFVLTVHEPLQAERTGDAAADTLALTTAINDALSRFIRETPDQWLWFHRRWGRTGT